jgi:gamma-glutamylcyclotransferase (GGCT)/AIG2-like uncharacterized protein YtfP
VLYFAYGSNLDSENWELWCRNNGYDSASIEPLGRAWLPDHELVFHYQSRLRRGGALDVQRRRGTSIPGALFRVHDWEGLDAKEGVPGGYYRRMAVTALTDDGHAHGATTYTVCARRIGSFVAPGPEYREIVTRGLSRFGHGHEAFLAAAEGVSAPAAPSTIFAYGTLMRGQRSHDLLESRVQRAHGPARIGGASLVRIDWYPGLVLGSDGSVHGELYEIDDVASLLHELDEYEDFVGYDDADSMYRRSLVSALTNAGPMLAWTYIYLGDPAVFPLIPSGRWTDA